MTEHDLTFEQLETLASISCREIHGWPRFYSFMFNDPYLNNLIWRIPMREFETGATRDDDKNKLDFEGFLSPSVLKRYAQYMHQNRIQADDEQRDSDNWQKGIPLDAYIKSMWRHFYTAWEGHREDGVAGEEELCALLFNVMGYLHEVLRPKPAVLVRLREQWIDLYTSRLPFIDQLNCESTLDFDAGLVRLRHRANLYEGTITFEEMNRDFDGAITRFTERARGNHPRWGC